MLPLPTGASQDEIPAGIEGRPLLPQGSGDGQSPADLRALEVYELRMAAFEQLLTVMGRRPKRRNRRDYTRKNCEEARGGP